jgi:hypothetical protein
MSDVNNPLAWVHYAEQDWQIAKSALRRKVPLVLPACFHAQQCAEKYLKILLITQAASFPKTHDLLTLENLCQQAGIVTGFRLLYSPSLPITQSKRATLAKNPAWKMPAKRSPSPKASVSLDASGWGWNN